MYIIGVDIGTTNTKAVAFTMEGKVLCSAGTPNALLAGENGSHELDPESLYEGVLNVLRQVLQQTADQEGLSGISFSCAMHSFIAVDGNGKPLTAAITWADLRSKDFAAALKGTASGKRIYRQTGTPIHPMSPLTKLLWLKETRPLVFRDAARFISIKEFIWWRLFGKYRVDYSLASATGLFDIYSFDWNGEALELTGITADRLSVPVPCTHTEKTLLPAVDHLLKLPAGLPFIIGGGDGAMANLGSHAVRPGETALTIGTSGAVRMIAAAPRHDPKERIFNYVITKKMYLCGGATNNGGGAVEWYIENFLGRNVGQGKDLDAFVEEASTVAAGCEGLIFLPYLQGERAPVWDADAKGVYFGIRSEHTQRHFMRALIEGVSYALFQVGSSLEETIGPIECIYASGGFTRSRAWLQLIADVFNRKVQVTNMADASAIGAAIMGFYAVGLIAELEDSGDMIRVQETYEPDEQRHAIYRRNFGVFASLYERLQDLM